VFGGGVEYRGWMELCVDLRLKVCFCRLCSLKMCSKVVLSKFVCSPNSFEVYVRQRTVSKYELFKGDAPSGNFEQRNHVIAMFDSIMNERSKLVRFDQQNRSRWVGVMEAKIRRLFDSG
jgi:hypothetical protein